MLRKINYNAKIRYFDFIKPIRGTNGIVEIDEFKLVKRRYNRGHRVEGVWILGLIEKTVDRKIIFTPVENQKKEALIYFIRRFVLRAVSFITIVGKAILKFANFYTLHC
ncbi:hypothetical protein H311_02383 [Anncaliia algerae PRA109]|nr:hypothetical protein H311_02383 [Anncaliia algerae PRA109]